MSRKRPKVLISAFACHPHKGSEPGVGYNYVRNLAEECDLTVIVEEIQNRSALEEERQRDPVLQQVDWHFIPWPSITRDGRRNDGVHFLRYYQLYRNWQQQAFRLAGRLCAESEFDLVHHLTMIGFREPGYLWKLPQPFFWGPIGGHVMMPWSFMKVLGLRGAVQCSTRNLLNTLQMKWSSRVQLAAKKATVLFASTSTDVAAIKQYYGRQAVLLGENGAPAIPDGRQRTRNPNQVLRLGWSGVHLPRKALPILLHALTRLPKEVAVELHILGDGPETSRWQTLATRLNIERKCRFYGWLPRNEALDVMQSLDAFAITSLQDACSSVLFEALALGLPVISHATCGFKDVLTQECGLLVPLESPAQSVDRFAQGIEKLFRDPPLYQRLSQGALRRAGELSWKQRASVVIEHYGQIVQQKRRAA